MATRLVSNQNQSKISIIDGGNPEVNNQKMNLCFSLKNGAKAQCLNQIYKDVDILVLPNGNRPIVLAGRGELKEKTITFTKEERRVVIYLNTKNVKKPIKLNITQFKKSISRDRVILDIAKEDIKDTLTLKDREGKLLLKYKIKL